MNRLKLKWIKESATLNNSEGEQECRITLLYEEGLWKVDLIKIISEEEKTIEESKNLESLREAYFWAEEKLKESNVDAL